MRKILVILIFLLIFGCISPKQNNTFHYQLQNTEFEKLKELEVNFLIIDLDDSGLTKQEIAELKNDGKIVLCYLSIGEAEDYRDYWEYYWEVGNPSFIDEENPDWEGNYRVKYWELAWQDIISDKVGEIVEHKCSGVYLDTIDSYYYYEGQGNLNAADKMISFVDKINKKAKGMDSSFLIVPQNAEELYEFQDYKKIIDGIGKEDIWFDDDEKIENVEGLYYLEEIAQDGKFVLAIDYPTEQSKVCEFYQKCYSHGFYCTISNRELNLDKPIECG